VAIDVFEGNVGDPTTLAKQIEKVRSRFGLERIVFVGNRGVITEARIRKELLPAQLGWIRALRSSAIQGLIEGGAPFLSHQSVEHLYRFTISVPALSP